MAVTDFASSQEAKHHPDCCMAISQPLLHNLANLVPSNGLAISVLSVGSGSGLLESLLDQLLEEASEMFGVEVSPLVNKYLPEEKMFFVGGTWDLCQQAAKSQVWMFTYPREPNLIARYLDAFQNSCLCKVVWLGPKMDWQDYEPIFVSSRFSRLTLLEDCGAAAYEMVVVAELP